MAGVSISILRHKTTGERKLLVAIRQHGTDVLLMMDESAVTELIGMLTQAVHEFRGTKGGN